MTGSSAPPAPDLRERKKLEAMRRIQAVALDLFDRDGYSAVTVEQVAAAANVSPSSVYRHFGTKERLVLHDEYDPLALELLRSKAIPGDTLDELLASLRLGVAMLIGPLDRDALRQIERRMKYVVSEPAVNAGMMRDAQQMEAQIRDIVAERVGDPPGSLRVRVWTAAVVWGFLAAVYHWVENGFAEPLAEVLDSALALLTEPRAS